MRTPRLGDIVHAVSYGTRHGEFPAGCHPAIITWIHPDEPGTGDCVVDLTVFKPWGHDLRPYTVHDDGEPAPDEPNPLMCGHRDYPGATWHWGRR